MRKPDSFEWIDLPVGPQPLSAWCADLAVDWYEGYGNPPGFNLKARATFTVLDRDGSYRKVELAFDTTFGSYRHWTGPSDSAELNMGILPRGVVATIVDDGELAIVVPSTGTVNRVADKGVSTAMKLANWGEKIVYVADGAVWQLRMAP